MKMTTAIFALAAIASMLFAPTAFSQDFAYPTKPISLVVPVPPGGILDAVARIIAPPLSQRLGQQLLVINKSGAGGNIATDFVVRSEPTGYTLLLGYSMFLVGNPAMYNNLSWDPIRDLAPIGMLAVSPHVLTVHPSVPVKTLRELVDYARANPGKLNYATSGNGSVPHVGMELFKQQNQLKLEHVAYKGAGPAVQDVVAGNAEMIVITPPSLLGFIQAGKLRPIAVAAKQRLTQLPDVPTAAEAGFPNFELEAWPAKSLGPVVKRLTAELKEAPKLQQVKVAFDTAGIELRYLSPTELDALVRHDVDYWGRVVKKADIHVE